MQDLIKMKEALITCVQDQICGNLENASTEELGEAVDMIKDLSEAIYYCTITDSMNREEYKPKQDTYYYTERIMPRERRESLESRYEHNYPGVYNMYTNGGRNGSFNGGDLMGGNGSSNYYREGFINPYYQQPMMLPSRDMREGNSPMYRKMYMEGKVQNKDKAAQMQELEKYMQELSQDLVDMIKDASPEEKQLLQQKISTLSTKIR